MNAIGSKIWKGLDPFAEYPKPGAVLDLQGWGSDNPFLLNTVNLIKPRVIVEIGVWKGGSTINMARRAIDLGLDCTVIAIDTWLGAWDHWISDEWFASLDFKDGYPNLFATFATNVSLLNLKNRIVPLPLDSLNAVEVLRQNSIVADIIHIDGGHDYAAVKADIAAWWPLLRPGGALVGDDYNITNDYWPGVKRAFDEFVAAEHVELVAEEPKCRLIKPA